MAGRKNHLQQMGYMGKDLSGIKDPVERDFAYRGMNIAPYCKHCGEVILQSFEDKHGKPIDSEWETINRAHYNCFLNWQDKEKARIAEEERRKAEEAANFDWEQYIKDMMDKKG